MSEDEIIKNLNDLLEHNYLEDVGYLREENDYVVYNNAIKGLLDLYQQKCKQNKDAKDYIEYYLLDNMKIEGNAKNTHEELKKLYNTLGGDNLR
jgi:hypothetical protein